MEPQTDTYNQDLINRNSLIRAFVIGLAVGLLGWLIAWALQEWVISTIFCRSADTASVCANAGTVSWVAAYVIVGVASLFALIRAAVYRPLLVVVASFIALWGIGGWLAGLVWWQAIMWQTFLFGIAYALFAWLATLDRFLYALAATVGILVVIRLIAAL